MSDADARIADILRRIGELPESTEINPEQRLQVDLGIDSLKLIDVIMLVEEELHVEIGDEFPSAMVTVSDISQYVNRAAQR